MAEQTKRTRVRPRIRAVLAVAAMAGAGVFLTSGPADAKADSGHLCGNFLEIWSDHGIVLDQVHHNVEPLIDPLLRDLGSPELVHEANCQVTKLVFPL